MSADDIVCAVARAVSDHRRIDGSHVRSASRALRMLAVEMRVAAVALRSRTPWSDSSTAGREAIRSSSRRRRTASARVLGPAAGPVGLICELVPGRMRKETHFPPGPAPPPPQSRVARAMPGTALEGKRATAPAVTDAVAAAPDGGHGQAHRTPRPGRDERPLRGLALPGTRLACELRSRQAPGGQSEGALLLASFIGGFTLTRPDGQFRVSGIVPNERFVIPAEHDGRRTGSVRLQATPGVPIKGVALRFD